MTLPTDYEDRDVPVDEDQFSPWARMVLIVCLACAWGWILTYVYWQPPGAFERSIVTGE